MMPSGEDRSVSAGMLPPSHPSLHSSHSLGGGLGSDFGGDFGSSFGSIGSLLGSAPSIGSLGMSLGGLDGSLCLGGIVGMDSFDLEGALSTTPMRVSTPPMQQQQQPMHIMASHSDISPNSATPFGSADVVPPPKSKAKGHRKVAKAKDTGAAAASSSAAAFSGAEAQSAASSSQQRSRPQQPQQQAHRPRLLLQSFHLGPSSTPVFHKLSSSASAAQAAPGASLDDLRSLALEAGRMGRDAASRAARLEAELRKFESVESFDGQAWFQRSSKVLASLPLPHDELALASELASLVAAASDSGGGGDSNHGKRKRNDGGSFGGQEGFGGTTGKGSSAGSSVPGGGKKQKRAGASAAPSAALGSTSKRGAATAALEKNALASEWSFLDEIADAEDDEEYLSDGGGTVERGGSNKPKKKKNISEKEKARQIASFWSDEIDPYFDFPSSSSSLVETIQPRDEHDFYASYHGESSSGSTAVGEKKHHQCDPGFSIPQLGEHWRDVAERVKEEEAAREKAAKEKADREKAEREGLPPPIPGPEDEHKDGSAAASAAGGAASSTTSKKKKPSHHAARKPKSLTASLSCMGIDDLRIRKHLLEQDKLLGGDKTFHLPNGQSLAQRVLSMMMEPPPGAARIGPWTAPKEKPASSATTTAAPSAATAITSPANSTAAMSSSGGVGPPPPPLAAAGSGSKKVKEYSVDKRIEMELNHLGLLNGMAEFNYHRELLDRTDDELSAALRSAQKELSLCLEALNPPKQNLYPTAVRVQDNGAKMAALYEAETNLINVYKTRVLGPSAAASAGASGGGGGKKTLSGLSTQYASMPGSASSNDAVLSGAIDSWNSTMRSPGSRRMISGFIPNPVDIGGIPRTRLHEYIPFRDYADVFARGEVVDSILDPQTGAVVQRGPPWTHYIPPQHPHNPDYHDPPPPPPPPPAPAAVQAPVAPTQQHPPRVAYNHVLPPSNGHAPPSATQGRQHPASQSMQASTQQQRQGSSTSHSHPSGGVPYAGSSNSRDNQGQRYAPPQGSSNLAPSSFSSAPQQQQQQQYQSSQQHQQQAYHSQQQAPPQSHQSSSSRQYASQQLHQQPQQISYAPNSVPFASGGGYGMQSSQPSAYRGAPQQQQQQQYSQQYAQGGYPQQQHSSRASSSYGGSSIGHLGPAGLGMHMSDPLGNLSPPRSPERNGMGVGRLPPEKDIFGLGLGGGLDM